MNITRNGIYYLKPSDIPKSLNSIVTREVEIHIIDTFVKLHISTSHDLFFEFARTFAFPEYFGFSSDALLDCLVELKGDHVVFLGIRPEIEGLFLPVLDMLNRACVWHTFRKRRFTVLVTRFPVALSKARM
jgi:hypothetical protein